MRPDKSSATGNENASRSSSWFRFDDGISVLVHFFVSSLFTLQGCSLCGVGTFLAHFGVEKKRKNEKRKKTNDHFRCFHLLWVESHVSLITPGLHAFLRFFILSGGISINCSLKIFLYSPSS